MGIDQYGIEAGLCVSHCEHGGTCVLEAGHEETHSSVYCRWTDKEAISKEEADKRLAAKPGGPEILSLERIVFGDDDA